MVFLKSCPRCSTGDVVLEEAENEATIRCVQCGHEKYYENRNQAARAIMGRSPGLAVTSNRWVTSDPTLSDHPNSP